MRFNTKTKSHLQSLGFIPCVTEHYNSFSKKKIDLYGLADMIAIREGEALLLQITSRSNISVRYRKIVDDVYEGKENHRPTIAKTWLSIQGGRILIIGWDDCKPKTKEGRIVEIILEQSGDLAKRELDINLIPIIKKGVQHESRRP